MAVLRVINDDINDADDNDSSHLFGMFVRSFIRYTEVMSGFRADTVPLCRGGVG